MVDDEIAGNQRVDLRRVTAQPDHRGTHGRQIDHGRNTGEVLQDNSSGTEGNLGLADLAGVVGRQRPDVILGHDVPVHGPQTGLEQDLDAVRHAVEVAQCVELPDIAIAQRGLDRLTGLIGEIRHGLVFLRFGVLKKRPL